MSPTRAKTEAAPAEPGDDDYAEKITEPEEQAEAALPEPGPAPEYHGKMTEPTEIRHTANAWWCPNDDRSMPLDMMECPVDGYPRPESFEG